MFGADVGAFVFADETHVAQVDAGEYAKVFAQILVQVVLAVENRGETHNTSAFGAIVVDGSRRKNDFTGRAVIPFFALCLKR